MPSTQETAITKALGLIADDQDTTRAHDWLLEQGFHDGILDAIQSAVGVTADDYDWSEAMGYGVSPEAVPGFEGSMDDVTWETINRVLLAAEGDNDGPDWVCVMRLRDGRFASLNAGCDYTGWD